MAASPSDALVSLRAAVKGKSIALLTDAGEPAATFADTAQISLDGTIFPRSTPTRYSLSTLKAEGNDFYLLDTIVFAYLSRDKSVSDYMKDANDVHVGYVSVTDRRSVIDFLESEKPEWNWPKRVAPLEDAAGAKRKADDATPTQQPAAPPKKRYTPDTADQERVKLMSAIVEGPFAAYKNQIVGIHTDPRKVVLGKACYKNRETALRGKLYRSFENDKKMISERIKAATDALAGKPAPKTAAPTADPKTVTAPAKRRNLTPIIMLSPSDSSLLTMENARAFLESSEFIDPQKARAENTFEDVISILHKSILHKKRKRHLAEGEEYGTDDHKTRYIVVDSVEALVKVGGDDAWDRVVSVVTTGQEWQFRHYKWSQPRDLFQNVKGFTFQYTNVPLDPKLKTWNVSVIHLDQNRRHIDKSAAAEFWRTLETFIAEHKPWLNV